MDPLQKSTRHTRRSRTENACVSCRQSKTRCEPFIEHTSGKSTCHRCSVLSLHCVSRTRKTHRRKRRKKGQMFTVLNQNEKSKSGEDTLAEMSSTGLPGSLQEEDTAAIQSFNITPNDEGYEINPNVITEGAPRNDSVIPVQFQTRAQLLSFSQDAHPVELNESHTQDISDLPLDRSLASSVYEGSKIRFPSSESSLPLTISLFTPTDNAWYDPYSQTCITPRWDDFCHGLSFDEKDLDWLDVTNGLKVSERLMDFDVRQLCRIIASNLEVEWEIELQDTFQEHYFEHVPCLTEILPLDNRLHFTTVCDQQETFILSTVYLLALPYTRHKSLWQKLFSPLRMIVDRMLREELSMARIDERYRIDYLSTVAIYLIVHAVLRPREYYDKEAIFSTRSRGEDNHSSDDLLEYASDLHAIEVLRVALQSFSRANEYSVIERLQALLDSEQENYTDQSFKRGEIRMVEKTLASRVVLWSNLSELYMKLDRDFNNSPTVPYSYGLGINFDILQRLRKAKSALQKFLKAADNFIETHSASKLANTILRIQRCEEACSIYDLSKPRSPGLLLPSLSS